MSERVELARRARGVRLMAEDLGAVVTHGFGPLTVRCVALDVSMAAQRVGEEAARLGGEDDGVD